MSTEEAVDAAGSADGRAGREFDANNLHILQFRLPNELLRRSKTFRLLLSSSPAFRILMFGTSISMFGSRISTVAFPMLVLNLYNSPFITGLVAFAAIAPSMLAYVPAGALVDRLDPRRVMLVSETLRGLAVFSVVLALLVFKERPSIAVLILAMVAEEILEIFSTLADRRYLTRLMERDKIAARQASVEVRTHAVVLAGRPVGPFLFALNPVFPFLADTISFVASILSLLALRRSDELPKKRRRQRLKMKEVAADIGQGFAWLKNDRRALLTVSLMAGTSLVAQALVLMFLAEAHSRQLSTVATGLVLAASGAGGATGAVFSKCLSDGLRRYWLPIQLVTWTIALSLLAATGSLSPWANLMTMFVLGFTGAIGNISFATYLIANLKDDMIARVSAIGQLLSISACAIGPVLGGAAVQHYGVNGAVQILLSIVIFLTLASVFLRDDALQIGRRLLWFIRSWPTSAAAIERPVPGEQESRDNDSLTKMSERVADTGEGPGIVISMPSVNALQQRIVDHSR